MALLVLGLILFLGIHALPWQQSLRQQVINKFGFNAYRGLFSLVALLGLILIIVGKAKADFEPLWMPPTWGRTAALPLMFVALILLPAANMPLSNIKRIVRHPMLVGILLWSCAHLLANGDLASVLLFGGFGLYSVIDIISANGRQQNTDQPRAPITKDIMVIAAGVIAFTVLLFAHPYLFGVPILL